MEFVDLKAQYERIAQDLNIRIDAVLRHCDFILGPEVHELEASLAINTGVRHAVGVANGTDALQLALMACDIGPGDAVFTTAFSFFATAEVIPLVGATPVFVDIDPETYNVDPALLDHQIGRVMDEGRLKPKAVIAVDLFGLPADYDRIERVCAERGVFLIEDAAQSFGARIGQRKAGSFGDLATTSFFPAKPLGCYGDGGAVFTNNDELASRIRSLRLHGKGEDKYDNVRVGVNSRLDTLQAAILLAKLNVFPDELERRENIAAAYSEALRQTCVVPIVPDGYCSSWAQYTIRIDSKIRDKVIGVMGSRGIPTNVYYRRPLHLQSAFAALGNHVGDFPIAERAASSVLSLPMHPYLSEEDLAEVTTALHEAKECTIA